MKNIYISSDASEKIISSLTKYGYRPILLPRTERLQLPVSKHADMLLHRLGEKLLLCGYYFDENKELFSDDEVLITDETHGEKYPNDILFNTFVYNNKLVGRIDCLSCEILKYYSECEMIKVKQGYAKCSCIVTPNICITADCGIYEALGEKECLIIRQGDVGLEGYDHGFIGGASYYDNGVVYFFGNVYTHPDGEYIVKTLKEYDIECICLSDGTLCDLGGAVL